MLTRGWLLFFTMCCYRICKETFSNVYHWSICCSSKLICVYFLCSCILWPTCVFNLLMCFHLLLYVLFSRWQLPNEQPSYLASTANERRRDRAPAPMDPEKLKAVIAGYSQSIFSCLKKLSSSVLEDLLFLFWIVTVGKAFIAATFLVFGGATAVMLYTADKLQLHSVSHVIWTTYLRECRTF